MGGWPRHDRWLGGWRLRYRERLSELSLAWRPNDPSGPGAYAELHRASGLSLGWRVKLGLGEFSRLHVDEDGRPLPSPVRTLAFDWSPEIQLSVSAGPVEFVTGLFYEPHEAWMDEGDEGDNDRDDCDDCDDCDDDREPAPRADELAIMRYKDAWRHASLYESLLQRGIESGALPPKPTREQIEAHHDALRAEGRLEGVVHELIGDDLSEADLDNLWAVWNSRPRPESAIPGWWRDKPHQIAYRLLLRLTRAEATIRQIGEGA